MKAEYKQQQPTDILYRDFKTFPNDNFRYPFEYALPISNINV